MMRTLWIGAMALISLATGCESPTKNGPTGVELAKKTDPTGGETAKKNDATGADLAKKIQESQQAGFERHDLDAFLAIWADDAKRIVGRTEKPDKYDTVLTRAQLEATHKLRFAVPPPKGA